MISIKEVSLIDEGFGISLEEEYRAPLLRARRHYYAALRHFDSEDGLPHALHSRLLTSGAPRARSEPRPDIARFRVMASSIPAPGASQPIFSISSAAKRRMLRLI